MRVELIAWTPEPEKVVAAAAKLCYSKSDAIGLLNGLTQESAARFINMLGNLGHASPLEHASFTFAISGISRACLAQITRHRVASYSVQSQRYVDMADFKYVVPPEIETDEDTLQLFDGLMEDAAYCYKNIQSYLTKRHEDFLVEHCHMSQESAHKKAVKLASEDARFVLPNACTTNMVMTMNARSLLNFFYLRCCNRAQWEIQELAMKMYQLVYGIAPALFANAGPKCVTEGKCSEGSMTCGRKAEMIEKFDQLRKEESL